MGTRIPTRVGDVLILQTTQSFTVYAVGAVSQDGQQDFGNSVSDIVHAMDATEAAAAARSLSSANGRVFYCDIDSGDWLEISESTDFALELGHREKRRARNG